MPLLDGAMSATPEPIPRNSVLLDTDALRRVLPDAIVGDELRACGISIDSRTLEPGNLFVALRGGRDGHAFVGHAAARGAAGAIVERGRATAGIPCVEVDDPLTALARLAAARRDVFPGTVVAIGGAAGKTTTTMLTGVLLAEVAGPTHVTRGNQNNLLGVAMTILAASTAARAWVIECGTSRRGELLQIANIVRPDVSVLLNIAYEHVDGIGGIDAIAEEEGHLLRAARVEAIANAGDTRARLELQTSSARRSTFGRGGDVALLDVGPFGLRTKLRGEVHTVPLSIPGEAAALDACAALACAVAVGIDDSVLAAGAKRAFATVPAPPGRFATQDVRGVLIVDDCYNANPASVEASLSTARTLANRRGGRLIAVLADMLELGDVSVAEHGRIGALARREADVIILVGKRFTIEGAARARGPAEAADLASLAAERGDVVLVKGSRAMGLEATVVRLCR